MWKKKTNKNVSTSIYLHKPVVRRSLVCDINFALHVIKLHVFALIHHDQLQWVGTLSQDCVDAAEEPVSVEHLSVDILPQWGDPKL